MLPLLGLPTLTAWCNQRGHEAEAVDLEALGVNPARFTERFASQRDRWPDVVGVTALTISRRGAREIVQGVRQAGFTGPVVVGGVYATTHAQEPLEWGADLVVTGECEGNILALLEAGATGVQAGQPAPIEEIPAPDWRHFSPLITTYDSNIRSLLWPMPGISMWTRGCPFKCIFCSNIVFGGRRTRYRPPQNVEADMLALKALGVRNCYVYDDELVGMPIPDGWMADVADRIAGLGIRWLTQGRCSKRNITLELMQDVRRAGGHTVFWGVESFSNRILRAVKKGTNTDDIWHTLRVAREAGINNAVFTMIGNYQETEEDLALTCAGLKAAYDEGLIQMRQTTICTPMPGTKLAEIAQAEGWYNEAPEFGPQMLQHSPTPWVSAGRAQYWMRRFEDACPVRL
jgi:radical SAM superfamily enzyme YgiQ (UPF0313 family)